MNLLLHLSLAFLLVLVWGFNFIVIEVELQQIPPLFLSFARCFLASIPAVFFVKFPSASFRMVALYALFMFILLFTFLFVGMHVGITPGLSSLVMQAQVFFTILLAIWFFNETITRWQIMGGLLAFSGIGLIAMTINETTTVKAFLFVLAAAASLSGGNLIAKKIGKVNMISLIAWGSLIAWPPLLALSLIFEGPTLFVHTIKTLTWISSGAVLYLTYLSTMFGFGTWTYLIYHYRLSIISPFTLLVPVIAIASSVMLLGEPLTLSKVVAGILIIAGLTVNLFDPQLFAKNHPPKEG